MQSRNLLHFFTTQVRNQCLTHGSHLRLYAPPVPNVHLNEAGRLDSFDVDRFTVIEYREVRAEARALDDLAQVWHREFAQCHALHCLSTETEDADAERVLARFEITTHVAAADQRPQQITGR